MVTYEAADRKQFAAVVLALRAAGALQTYGRDQRFGRVAIARNQKRYTLSTWTNQQVRLNLHYIRRHP